VKKKRLDELLDETGSGDGLRVRETEGNIPDNYELGSSAEMDDPEPVKAKKRTRRGKKKPKNDLKNLNAGPKGDLRDGLVGLQSGAVSLPDGLPTLAESAPSGKKRPHGTYTPPGRSFGDFLQFAESDPYSLVPPGYEPSTDEYAGVNLTNLGTLAGAIPGVGPAIGGAIGNVGVGVAEGHEGDELLSDAAVGGAFGLGGQALGKAGGAIMSRFRGAPKPAVPPQHPVFDSARDLINKPFKAPTTQSILDNMRPVQGAALPPAQATRVPQHAAFDSARDLMGRKLVPPSVDSIADGMRPVQGPQPDLGNTIPEMGTVPPDLEGQLQASIDMLQGGQSIGQVNAVRASNPVRAGMDQYNLDPALLENPQVDFADKTLFSGPPTFSDMARTQPAVLRQPKPRGLPSYEPVYPSEMNKPDGVDTSVFDIPQHQTPDQLPQQDFTSPSLSSPPQPAQNLMQKSAAAWNKLPDYARVAILLGGGAGAGTMLGSGVAGGLQSADQGVPNPGTQQIPPPMIAPQARPLELQPSDWDGSLMERMPPNVQAKKKKPSSKKKPAKSKR
jgi:hypothetical protein